MYVPPIWQDRLEPEAGLLVFALAISQSSSLSHRFRETRCIRRHDRTWGRILQDWRLGPLYRKKPPAQVRLWNFLN